MKKLFYCTLAVAVMSLFAACQKDGKFNPKEKIANVYEESLYISSYNYDGQTYGDTTMMPKRLTERWTWDGNKLTKIAYIDYWQTWNGNTYVDTAVEYIVNFTYDGKQLAEANSDGQRIVFSYDGSKLEKAEVFEENNATAIVTLDFEHDGKKINKIVVTQNWDGSGLDKSQPVMGRMERMLLGNMLPDLKPVEKVFAKARKSGAKGTVSETINLTWDGDNVSKMVITYGNESSTSTYVYDDKNNPYQGFMYAIDYMMEDGPVFVNENNIVKAVYQYSDYDGKGSSEVNFTYTYDGKWPTSRKQVYSDNYEGNYYYDSETKYFEYK